MRNAFVCMIFSMLVCASPSFAADYTKEPPGGRYHVVPNGMILSDFPPALGKVYVDQDKLPVGPYLAYDQSGKLVCTIYMLSMKEMDAHKDFDDLLATDAKVDHVNLYYNAGHPYMEMPHYHFALWHISREEEQALYSKLGQKK